MARDPLADLRRIAFLLERDGGETHRVRAFRRAAAALDPLGAREVARRVETGTLAELPGVGTVTARCVAESQRGEVPVYLRRLEATAGQPLAEAGAELRSALRGDLHAHTDWSDGGSSLTEMAATARDLGHDYLAVTDHSPRLTVAHGLSPQRLRDQLAEIRALTEELAPFRLLTGIEVDILADGSLDQTDELLGELDIVVASIHSGLKLDRAAMTERMLAAVAHPQVNVLGHCTGRKVRGPRHRAESDFDAEAVFAACREHDVAVEINCRPDRLDPPKRLLRLAVEAECQLAVDTDAHAPGQLDWQAYGCERAAACGVPVESVVNTWPVGRLLRWAGA